MLPSPREGDARRPMDMGREALRVLSVLAAYRRLPRRGIQRPATDACAAGRVPRSASGRVPRASAAALRGERLDRRQGALAGPMQGRAGGCAVDLSLDQRSELLQGRAAVRTLARAAQ